MPFDDLISRIEALHSASRDRRIIIGIAGSPGGGKTTLASGLVEELNRTSAGQAIALPMDGYHLANSTLSRLGLRDRKGALETFDGWGFVALLKRVRTERGHTIFAPSFERTVDEPVAGEIAIEDHHRIVIVEGNYLLVDAAPWDQVREIVDEAWFCATPEDARIERLVARHMYFGRTREDATAWATDVDGVNAKLIEATRHNATLVVSGETGEILPS